MQDLTEYTKSLQAQYQQQFGPTSAKEKMSENDSLISLEHKEWDDAVNGSQQEIPLPETVHPIDSKSNLVWWTQR